MTDPRLSVPDLIRDAQWLAHRYDPGHDAFHFRFVPRARHAQVPFLIDDHLGQAEPLVVRRDEAVAAAPSPAPIHFIFHSAYCCSTLLAAAFDIEGVAMGLKEPVLLNDLIGWRHRGAAGAEVARTLDHGLALLARPFGPGEAVVVKPSNIVNPLIPAMLAMRQDSRALLLHAPLDDYLASIARKGMWGRLWVRDLFGKLLREGMLAPLGLAPDQYLALTDIQIAAAGWLAQHRQFDALARQFGGRVATLTSQTLVNRPRETLVAAADLFGLSPKREQIAAIVAGPVFARDAKTGANFAEGQRQSDARQGMLVHAEEVEKVSQWAHLIADNAGIPLTLPGALAV
jgi:hypothetical protein